MTATWPDIHFPGPRGPTALQHMKIILKAAQDAKSPNLTDIDKAIEACKKADCLYGDPPQRGKPPAEATHKNSILAARLYAGNPPDWDECLKALRHGEALAEQARKPKGQSP